MKRAPLLLLDTNVLLDILLAREPWVEDATRLLDAIQRGAARGAVSVHAITTIHYVVRRATDVTTAATAVSDLLSLLPVVALDSADLSRALSLRMADYEDAVQVAAALKCGADFLITRNPKDFRGSPVTVRSPSEVRALIAGRK